MKKLAWAVPTLLSIFLVQTATYTGFILPVPFFIIIVCVMIAGAFGSARAGLLAGVFASLFVVKSYLYRCYSKIRKFSWVMTRKLSDTLSRNFVHSCGMVSRMNARTASANCF